MNKAITNQTPSFGFGHDFTLFTVGLSRDTLPCTVGQLQVAHSNAASLFDYRGPICDGVGHLYEVSAEGEPGGVLFLKTTSKLDHPIFPWMTEEEYLDIDLVQADPAYIESIKALLELALKASPVGKVYIYIRHQSTLEALNMAGTLSVERFMSEVVSKGRLLSNFVYILSDTAETDLQALVQAAL